MSAIAAPHPAAGAGAAASRPSLARLTGVELRKMVDTRAGFWTLLGIAAITVITLLATVLSGHPSDHALRPVARSVVQPVAFLLPIVAILLVTSEFSQRTALSTFALVPRRGRVMAAKLVAALLTAAIAFAICLALAVLGTALAAPGVAHTWSLSAGDVGQLALFALLPMATGIGFGALMLASAPAIVTFFALPIAFGALEHLHFLRTLGLWFDQSNAVQVLVHETANGTQWGRIATAGLLWTVLPVLAGFRRIARREIT